jgi:hypothetical protein
MTAAMTDRNERIEDGGVMRRAELAWISIVTVAAMGVFGAGCGAKTGLGVPPPDEVDAGPDAGVDAGRPDAGQPDAGIIVDECVELPFEEPPRMVQVSFLGRILAADVLFLVDTTGSMMEEIERIRETLRETLVPELDTAIGDARFSVASLADFDVGMYGEDGDLPFLLLQDSTDSVAEVQRALDRLPVSNGQDGPESQTEALYQVATGAGIGSFVPPRSCPAGTVGYPCFRSDGSRIVLLFTDAEFHNGPFGTNNYGIDVRPAPHSYAETVAALGAIGAKVLGLFSGTGDAAARRDLEAIARDTGAVDPAGRPIVLDIGSDGRLLDRGVVDAVRTLVDEVPIDIDLIVEDVEGDELDATVFVRDIVALRAEPADGAINLGDRFGEVRPGTRVFFSVLLQNELFPVMREPQSFLMRIVLRGDGVTRLQTTLVRIVIPGVSGETCDDF